MIIMLNAKAFANAAIVVGIAIYVVCRILSLVVPDILFAVERSWFHTLNLDAVKAVAPLDFGTFLLGGITLGAFVWISIYATVTLYNKWHK